MLEVFADTMTANDKYSLRNRKNLQEPIQLHLFKNKKIFYETFAAHLKSTSNLERFEKKDDPQRLCISEIRDSERRG